MSRPYLGAAEEEERKESVEMGCIYEFHIPHLRYIPNFVIFLKIDIVRSHNDIFEKVRLINNTIFITFGIDIWDK